MVSLYKRLKLRETESKHAARQEHRWRKTRQANRSASGLARKNHTMPKTGIHPVYEETHVKCACGNEFVDTAGRIDRFRRKFAATDAKKAEIAANAAK